MQITVNLSPEAETRLREQAARQGEEVETVATAVLHKALEWEAWDYQDAVEGIQRGLDAVESGRFRSFHAFAQEQRLKYQLPDS